MPTKAGSNSGQGANLGMAQRIGRWVNQQLMNDEQRRVFLNNVGRRLSRGITARETTQALLFMYNEGPERALLNDMMSAIRNGQRLTSSFSGWFPTPIVATLTTAEQHGKLPQEILHVAENIKEGSSAWSGVLGKLGYGVAILGAIFVIYIFVVHNNLRPVLTSLVKVPDENLENMLAIAAHINSFWIWYILVPVSVTLVAMFLLPTLTGNIRVFFDRAIPGMSAYRTYIGARLLESMAMMTAAGQTWRQAGLILEAEAPPYTKMLLRRFRSSLDEGSSVAEALHKMQCYERITIFEIQGSADSADLPVTARTLSQEAIERIFKVIERVGYYIQFASLISAAIFLMILILGLFAIQNSVG